MVRFTINTLATLELSLHWQNDGSQYIDRLVARRVNAWRDIFPVDIQTRLNGLAEKETATCTFAPGELVTPFESARVLTLPRKAFKSHTRQGRIPPRLGRFYPQGMFEGLPGVYPSTMTPARVIHLSGDTLTVDLNHPLSTYPLRVDAHVDLLQNKPSDTGGQLFHWAEELCNNGPGMQSRLPHGRTDFLDDDFLSRLDEDDGAFYARPRITTHVDAQAHANLTAMHARFLEPGMRVLDLMSSVQSHLPGGMDLRVTGLGMNEEEMKRNPRLNDHVVHDLNRDPVLPLDGPFDVVLLSLSVEYLTRPVEALESVRQILAPGGAVLVGMSNRWFPSKTIQGWTELHEFERMGYVRELLRQAGFTGTGGGGKYPQRLEAPE